MTLRENLERAALIAMAVTLVACSTSPRTELAWGVREHKSVPKPVARPVVANNNNTFYGPSSVTLPPVQKSALPPVRDAEVVPTPRPYNKQPAWYTQSNPQPAQQARYDNPPPRVFDSGAVRFVWPLSGRIVSDYGTSGGERNDGINIAAASGTPVHAAAAGTVSYCGNELKGFGNLVLIRHDNGYITAYAHVGSILVSRDQRVGAGDVIATTGQTGDVSSPQLHFEIRAADKHPVDPKSLLPKGMVVASNS